MQTISQDEQEPKREEIVLQETYRIVRQIGFGGMGVVYEAKHARLPGRFAVKVLLRSLMSNHEAFARFCREAQIMSELRHPHVVQIVDFNFTTDKQPYFVMEHLEGKDLEAQLAQTGPMEIERVVAIVDAVASALGAAHRRGIVHRDLKPSNIFLCDVDGQEAPFIKVLDFGVSKVTAGSRLTFGTKPVGTPQYMAPEQAKGRADDVEGHTDQFALAAIVYEMLTGHDAFYASDPVTLLYQIVHEEPQPLSRYIAGNCASVQAVLTRALAKDPAARYPTITAFASALRDAANPRSRSRTAAAGRPAPEPGVDATSQPAPGAPDKITGDRPWTSREPTGDLDRVPRSPYRAVALAVVAAALVIFVIAKGWARTLPDDVGITFHSLVARVTHEPPHPQPELPRAPHAAGSLP